MREFLKSGIDFFFPGPSDGRSGTLRRQILDLEVKKRDFNLRQLFELEARSPAQSSWIGLGTIAYEIVSHFKPQKIVELGSLGGFSTFAMGLALRDLKLGGRIYAVDTWTGDEHQGIYGEEVYKTFLQNQHKLGLDNTVFPLRMTFAEASQQIDPPIDLLHVDGLHTMSAVISDFNTFRHLLAPGAIVLFHDVYTKFRGMRLFWAFISRCYPSYRIPYSHGLWHCTNSLMRFASRVRNPHKNDFFDVVPLSRIVDDFVYNSPPELSGASGRLTERVAKHILLTALVSSTISQRRDDVVSTFPNNFNHKKRSASS